LTNWISKRFSNNRWE